MARIQHVEKARYIESNIGIYAYNKVGQYSKYLDKNPIFVTYYHISKPLSRTDVGTGGIESELGSRSPVRFNKILDFPLYNIPELKPDLVYDETGYDVELDLSDITILPNTLKPSPGDYFILSFPGIKEYLFRVNEFRYNTIQSNDFYSVSCDIKDIGQDLEKKRMEGQIVEEYQTVFDNIGTEDRCFVKTSDIDYLNSISDLYYKLREYYLNAFYNRDLNTVTYPLGYDCSNSTLWLDDPYLEKFINDSHIYYDEGSTNAMVFTLNAFKPRNFELNYSRTLYDALIRNSLEMLSRFPYSYYEINRDRFTTFSTFGYKAMVPQLYMTNKRIGEGYEVWDAQIIKYGDKDNENYKTEINGVPVNNVDIFDQDATYNVPWYEITKTPVWIPTWTCKCQYMSSRFIGCILDGELDTDDYCELVIFNYLHGIPMKYERPTIIEELTESLHNFYFLPMVIFVLGQQFQKYFKKERAFEL